MSTTLKAILRIVFAVMAILFLSLSTFKIMLCGCLILWFIDVVGADIRADVGADSQNTAIDRRKGLRNYDDE